MAVAAAARCGRLAGPFHASRTQLLRSASAPFLAAHPSGSSKFLTPRPRRSAALCSSSPLSPPRLLPPAIPPPPGPFCYSSRAPPWCCTPPVARPPRATHSRLRLVPRPGDLHGTSAFASAVRRYFSLLGPFSRKRWLASLSSHPNSLTSPSHHHHHHQHHNHHHYHHPCHHHTGCSRVYLLAPLASSARPAIPARSTLEALPRLTASSTPPDWSHLLRLPTAIAHRLAQAHSDIGYPGKITAVYAIISLSFPSLRHRPVSLSK